MKTYLRVTFAVLILALGGTAPVLQAAERPSKKEGANPGRGGERGDRLKMLSQQLSLTAEQQKQVAAIFKSEEEALQALRSNAKLSDEARRAKLMEIRTGTAAKIRAVLTPEQQSKYDTFMSKRGPGGPGGRGGPDRGDRRR